MSSLDEKIARARAEFEAAQPSEVPVSVGGELVTIAFLPVDGETWEEIKATNPPRPGSLRDTNVGYNTDGAAKDYPVERITVDGEPIAEEKWLELLSVLKSPSRSDVAAMLWGINWQEAKVELGKALKGSLVSGSN